MRALDSGSWFSSSYSGVTKPTLSEVLELCQGRTCLEIDLKHSSLDFLHKVIREIEDFNLVNEVELTTAHYPLLAYIKSHNPRLMTGTFFYEPPAWMPIRLAQQHVFDWADLLKIDMVHMNIVSSPVNLQKSYITRGSRFMVRTWRLMKKSITGLSVGSILFLPVI